MAVSDASLPSDVRRGVGFMLIGMLCISVNDMLIKQLSDDYPLHEMMFVRSGIAILVSLVIVQFEGGWRILRTDRPWLHALRGLLIVSANMSYFAALAVLPLPVATALFFVAPIFITLLSVPLLGERVGPWRIAAVIVGFLGVLLMLHPADDAGGAGGAGDAGGAGGAAPESLTVLLPMLAALFYACMQILTRRLGVSSRASAMAVYNQAMFIVVSAGFWIVAGDGRLADGVENASLRFLFRAWVWPDPQDWLLFLALGGLSAVVVYALTQAYRLAPVATIAPFEYVALPLAIIWGWAVFGYLPGPWVVAGFVLIVGAGLTVFLRERRRPRPAVARLPRRL